MSDLIKRADVINLLWYFQDECCSAVVGDFEKLPSADRPQGEWTNAGILTVHCSNCKSEFHELEAMNYCPHCGARMKGADDE